VVGCDFSGADLVPGRDKAAHGRHGVRFEWADALQMPYDGGRFDRSRRFGVRNLALDRACASSAGSEAGGGCHLEITQRSGRALEFYSLWFDRPSAARPLRRRPELTPTTRVGCQLPQPARARRENGPRRLRGGSAARCWRRDHRDPQRHPRVSERSAYPRGDGGARRLQPLAADRLGESRTAARDDRPLRGSRSRRRRGDAAPAASGCGPMLVLLCAGEAGGTAAVRAATAIDSSTWRPWSTTTSSTRRRCGAATDRRATRGAARQATATCCSRGPSRCSPSGDAGPSSCCDARCAGPRRARAAPGRFDSRSARSLPAALPLKTAKLFRMRLLLGFDDERLAALRRPRSGSPQLLDDVPTVTGPAERTGKARGTTCSTGRSRCR